MDMKRVDLPAEMEKETAQAKALAEMIRLVYAASCGKNTGVEFGDVQNALWLVWEMTDRHAERLNRLSDALFDRTADKREKCQ